MRLSAASQIAFCCTAVGLGAAAFTVFAQNAIPQGMQAEGLRYPMRDAKTGRKTADIVGESWSGTQEGAMLIKGLRLTLYGIDDRTNAVVETPECVCRLDKQTAESESDVRIAGNNMLITGRGFRWHASDRIMRIKSRVRIEIGRGAADLGKHVAVPREKGQD